MTKRTTLSSLPDDVLRRIFLHSLSTPQLLPTLSVRALYQSDTAFFLSSTCTRFRTIFRTLIHTLHIPWNTPVYLHTLASFFGPSLRNISITAHPYADVFLKELAQHQSLSLASCSLENCPVSEDALTRILEISPPLQQLHLSYIEWRSIDTGLCKLAHSFNKLHALTLAGASQLSHTTILAICKFAGTHLKHIALRYLRHPSICDDTLLTIASSCPNVTHLILDDVRHARARGIVGMCEKYAGQLVSLKLYACRVSAGDVCGVLEKLNRLEILGLEEKTWLKADGDAVMEGVAACENVRELKLKGLKWVADRHVNDLVQRMKLLEKVAIRGAEELTDVGVVYLSRIGKQLRGLDLRGCFVSATGLESLMNPGSRLESICLGGDGVELTREGETRWLGLGYSDDILERLVRACGEGLREFVWETPKCKRRGWHGRDAFILVGAGGLQLTGIGVLKALARWGQKLERVVINGLRPSAWDRVKRAKFDLAVMELEEQCQHAVVLVNDAYVA